jgi:hypothetical protein
LFIYAGDPVLFDTRIRIRDRKEKNPRSGINITDHISESLVGKFGVKILEFFVADPDPGSTIRCIFDPGYPSRIRNTGRL